MFRVSSIRIKRFSHMLNPLKLHSNYVMPIRNHGHEARYRLGPASPSKWVVGLSELFGGLLWWWMLSKTYFDWEHIVGHYDYPDPAKWTDEELGIILLDNEEEE